MLAYAYSINEYYDKKMNKKYFLLPLLFSIFSLLFLFPFNLFSLVFSLLFLTLTTFYSWPKIWLEGKPIISTLTNGIGFTLLLILPFNSFQKIIKYSSFIFLIFLLNIAAQLIHEIVDYKKDKKINKVTTCVKFGIKNTFLSFKFLLLMIILISLSLFS
ncbi:MAG: UbiA family prenyltransferase, partial [Thermoproteota archaeon]